MARPSAPCTPGIPGTPRRGTPVSAPAQTRLISHRVRLRWRGWTNSAAAGSGKAALLLHVCARAPNDLAACCRTCHGLCAEHPGPAPDDARLGSGVGGQRHPLQLTRMEGMPCCAAHVASGCSAWQAIHHHRRCCRPAVAGAGWIDRLAGPQRPAECDRW